MKFKSCKLSLMDRLRYWFFDIWYNKITPIFKKSSFETWAEREVRLAIASERKASGVENGWDYGSACYKSALRALKSLEKDGHSGFSIQMTKSILNRMIDWKPLTPIEDTPDGWNYSYMNKETRETVYQNKRMSSLFKHVRQDFKTTYRDIDHSICVDIVNQTRYHSGFVSGIVDEMFPITMPYMPSDKPIEIYCHDLLTDRKNGDFDTVGIFHCIKPDGERVEIKRYFKESSEANGWTEINYDEWIDRLSLDLMRKMKESPEWDEQDKVLTYSSDPRASVIKLENRGDYITREYVIPKDAVNNTLDIVTATYDLFEKEVTDVKDSIGNYPSNSRTQKVEKAMAEQPRPKVEKVVKGITRKDLEALEIAQTYFKQLSVEDDLYK